MKAKQFILCLMIIMALFSSIKILPNSANPDLDLATLSDVLTLDSQNITVNDRNYDGGIENDPTDSDSLELAVRFNEYASDNKPDQIDTGRWNYTDDILWWYEFPDSRSMEESYNSAANRSVRMAEEGFMRISHADLLAGAGATNYWDNDHSVGLWVRPYTAAVGGSGTYGTGFHRIFAKSGYYNIRIRGRSGGLLNIEYSVTGLGQLNSSDIGDGSWTNVFCKQAGSKMYIYLNGSLDVSYDFGGSASYTGTSFLYFTGYTSGQTAKTWHDDYFFWSKNVSDSSIASYYSGAPAYAYNQTFTTIVSGNWTGELQNNTISYYNYTYSIVNGSRIHEQSSEPMIWEYHNHTFYIPHNYTFVNVTFGNGTIKTSQDGFSISSHNSTHDKVEFTAGEVDGIFEWFFSTSNAITNFELNPDESNGTLNNVSSVQFNIRIANGSVGVVGSPISVKILLPDETVLTSVSSSTGANGWYNSSINNQFLHSTNNTYFIVATGLNDTFLGFMIKRFYAYNDWDAPVVTNIVYEDLLIEDTSFSLDVYVSDDFTELADLTIRIDYSFVSSGTLTESSSLTITANYYSVSLIGQSAGTTLWFQIILADNMSNTFESIVYQTDWEVAEEAVPAGGDGDGDGAPPSALQPAGGIPDVVLILLFGAGAVSVAVIGYAVLQRVQVRTRTVETREVLTGLGTFGRSEEKITVKGRKPKGRSKKAIKKARAKRKQK